MEKTDIEKLFEQGRKAKEASCVLSTLSTTVKNNALNKAASALMKKTDQILEANAQDMEAGKGKGMSRILLDRLLLTPERIEDMAEGLQELVRLPDPVGEVVRMFKRPNDLEIGQMRVPLGVVGIIYEARPNVTVDASGLCLKTGNAVILRGGSEAFHSNRTITDIIAVAIEEAGLPREAVQLVQTTDREAVDVLLGMKEYLDVLILRGGAELIQKVTQNAVVPVIETGIGNCHAYLDEGADARMAREIIVNAKTHRPSVCNAIEKLLVHKSEAETILPLIALDLYDKGVELRGCEKSRKYVLDMVPATEEDWSTEYLDLILAVKVVDNLEEAVQHIHKYGSKHSEVIITRDYHRARKFQKAVDSAVVYVNASTRFTDGYQFGFGAEIGISTQKLHARGPMGLEALTTTKFLVFGDGQVRI